MLKIVSPYAPPPPDLALRVAMYHPSNLHFPCTLSFLEMVDKVVRVNPNAGNRERQGRKYAEPLRAQSRCKCLHSLLGDNSCVGEQNG